MYKKQKPIPHKLKDINPLVPGVPIAAEQSTLGAMLIERVAIGIVTTDVGLVAEDFYREDHRVLFEVITHLSEANEPVDLITVPNELKNRNQLDGMGGLAYLMSLFDTVPTAANVGYYARIVQRHANRRRAALAAYHLLGAAVAPDANDADDSESGLLLDAAESLLMDSRPQNSGVFGRLHPLAVAHYEFGVAVAEGQAVPMGLRTGLSGVDRITGGLQNSDFIIIAARPSMGKTSMVLSIAEFVSLVGQKTVILFSLEMSKEQLALRMLCSRASVNSQALRTGTLEPDQWADLKRATAELSRASLLINDATDATPLTMLLQCRRIQREKQGTDQPLALVVVDYIQLMQASRRTENRQQEVGEIARGLKSLARELGVPVIGLSQLSRAVESRENKRPMLSDLRESGNLEAEADLIAFLYRDKYYKTKGAYEEGGGEDNLEETEVIIGKHRNGPTGMVKVDFWPRFARFQDRDDGSSPAYSTAGANPGNEPQENKWEGEADADF